MDTLNINYDDFNTNVCDGLQSILASSEMSDVTLAVEGKYFKAHQLILSMFSTYFRELFHVTPSRNTIFFMKNVKHKIMHNLLLFIYEGKVQIPSEDIQLFVDTANELKIKGLTSDMYTKAAEISGGQVHNADNIEHVMDSAPLLKRAAEPMKQKAKKHKPSNNEHDLSTSEASVSTLETNRHITGKKYCNMYGVQLNEEDTDIIDVHSTEMYGLDDKTNELDSDEDHTIASKEDVLPLASSKIDHPLIGDREESDIGEIQPSEEDTEEHMDANEVSPTQIHGLVDETRKLVGDKEDNSMTMGKDLLLAIDHAPLSQSSEGIPGTTFEAEVSRGQLNNAGKSGHVIDSAPSLKRASELMKHKPSYNEPDQSASESSVLTVNTIEHIIATEDFNLYQIQLKEEDANINIKTEPIEQVSNDLLESFGLVSFEQPAKEEHVNSLIEHPVIGDMEESDIDGIQSSEEVTKENMDLIDVGPTEIQGLDNETMKLDNTMTLGKHLPPPSQGILDASTYIPKSPRPGTIAFDLTAHVLSKAPARLITCCNEKKVAHPRDRRAFVGYTADFIVNVMRDTSRKTCAAVAQKIYTQYPNTFSDNVEGHIYGTGCESLMLQMYNAVMYRKAAIDKGTTNRTIEKDTNEESRQKDKNNLLKQDKYGCVDYSPELPKGETTYTQENKRKILLDMFSHLNRNDDDVARLMNETYATQRACINARHRQMAVVTTYWPFLKDAHYLISHFNRLVGTNMMNTWASFTQTKLKPLRQYLETYQYKAGTKTVVTEVIEECKLACAATRSDVPKSLIIFRLLMLYFKENENFFFKIIAKDVPGDIIATEVQCDNPVLLIRGDSLYDPNSTCTIVLERSKQIFCKDALQAVIVLFASYFVFGFAYPPEVEKTLEYMQREMMKINPTVGSKKKNKRRNATTYDAAVYKLAKEVSLFQKL